MIATERIADWLPRQRWFAGKDRPVDAVRVESTATLIDDDPGLLHAIVAVTQGGTADRYQLPLGRCTRPPEHLAGQLIAETGGHAYYDALADYDTAALLLDCFHRDTGGPVVFATEPGVSLESGLRARPIGVEQSNSSVVFGHHYILKLFRRVHAGPNRDLDMHRALRDVGCAHIARPLGAISTRTAGGELVLGMLQQFLPDAVEGWALATTSVRDLMAEGDLHAAEAGGDFSGEAGRLGEAVAAVHADLARALGVHPASRETVGATVRAMHQRLDGVLGMVPALARYEAGLREAFDAAASGELVLQHVHGDLHLGQTLRTNVGWILIDFEGEPAVPVAARRALRSWLVDIAGMLRSFDYASHQHLAEQAPDGDRAARAMEWVERNVEAFCDGYAAAGGRDPRSHGALLRAFVLDKAVYEVGYEAANRPGWRDIPLAAIDRLLR